MTTTRAPWGRLTGTDRDTARQNAAQLYSQGCTIQAVARQLHCSYGLARALLLEAHVVLRGRGGGIRKAGA
jgi:hypothetical protein